MIGREEMDKMSGKRYTVKDIEALPEGRRAELIDGQMYKMASPGRVHQRLLIALVRAIANYIEDGEGSIFQYPLTPFFSSGIL